MPIQFFVVMRRDGTINPRRIILAEFDDTGKLIRHTLDVPPGMEGAIIRISYQEFRRQVVLHGLRQSPPDTPAERKRKRDSAYRDKIAKKRPDRHGRRVDDATKEKVREMLAAGDSGVAVSLATGVSRSFVSRMKKELT